MNRSFTSDASGAEVARLTVPPRSTVTQPCDACGWLVHSAVGTSVTFDLGTVAAT